MTEKFAGWAVLELMGHRRLAGYVQDTEVAGGAFLRLDVPAEEHGENTCEECGANTAFGCVCTPNLGPVAATQFYSPSAVYCLTPTTEEAARAVAARSLIRPPALLGLPAPVTVNTAAIEECHRCEHPRSVHEDRDEVGGECCVRGCDCTSYLHAAIYDDDEDEEGIPF